MWGFIRMLRAAVIMDEDFYKRIHTGFDLIYKPAETKFMSLVRKNGGKAYHGLKMLLYQESLLMNCGMMTVAEEMP